MNDSRLPLNVVLQYRESGRLIGTGIPVHSIDDKTDSPVAAAARCPKMIFKSSADQT
jgi:hypothetical protein